MQNRARRENADLNPRLPGGGATKPPRPPLASLTARCLRFTNSVRSNEHLACAWCSFGRMLEVA